MKRKFNVGDIVICVAVKIGNKKHWNANWTKLDGVIEGKSYVVRLVNGYSISLSKTNYGLDLPIENFRLATPTEKRRFLKLEKNR